MRFCRIFIFSIILSAIISLTVLAQGEQVTYTIQVGDTLSEIALKYNVSLTQLTALNNISNPDIILAGQTLTIPGDHTSAAGRAIGTTQTYTVRPGDTLGTIASRFGVRTAHLAQVNRLANVDLIEVGQTLTIPTEQPTPATLPLPAPFASIHFSEPRIIQGRTLVIHATLATTATLTAEFETRSIPLAGDGRHYWGLVGIHALSEVGVYPVTFRATLPNGAVSTVTRDVVVTTGPYGTETIIVEPGREGLLAPEVVKAEATKLSFIWNQVTPQKLWSGAFRYPVDDPHLTSAFGTRRSYGGGPVNGFHAGTDFAGNGNPIYAPAAGVVVLAEPLNVRGNAVIINHGMGVFTGYWHQSKTVVHAGETVEPGDLIGYIGNTGLVTGPHLHWEMRVGGIAVDALQWVEEDIPNEKP